MDKEFRKKPPYPNYVRRYVKDLRQQATQAESKLWAILRKSRVFTGLKFRRQEPIGPFIVDFYCHAHKIVIEIDGASHEARVAYEKARENYLANAGLRVLRFSEKETLDSPESVLQTIIYEMNR